MIHGAILVRGLGIDNLLSKPLYVIVKPNINGNNPSWHRKTARAHNYGKYSWWKLWWMFTTYSLGNNFTVCLNFQISLNWRFVYRPWQLTVFSQLQLLTMSSRVWHEYTPFCQQFFFFLHIRDFCISLLLLCFSRCFEVGRASLEKVMSYAAVQISTTFESESDDSWWAVWSLTMKIRSNHTVLMKQIIWIF